MYWLNANILLPGLDPVIAVVDKKNESPGATMNDVFANVDGGTVSAVTLTWIGTVNDLLVILPYLKLPVEKVPASILDGSK